MKQPKVEFHNLTHHRLDFSVTVVGGLTDDGESIVDQIVVTIVELPAQAPPNEPEKSSP